ncbi:MAG: multidrug efflux SMR transporter [Planctomycetes bacterium]|nr:multidrug efflux SMR transporter [Planctomycetota bacterium]
MAWVYLMAAVVSEIIWAISLKYADGFKNFWPSVVAVVTTVTSMLLLMLAMRSIPVGTTYAIWTGLGAVGTVALGIILFNEPLNTPRILCVVLIFSGVIGLKLTAGHAEENHEVKAPDNASGGAAPPF